MTGSIALDSNAVIAYVARDGAVRAVVDEATSLILPAPVLGELLYGAKTSGRPVENEAGVLRIAARCDLASVDGGVAARYAAVRADLKGRGRPLPENDIWIAAVCLEREVSLLTLDRHFDEVRGLTVVRW